MTRPAGVEPDRERLIDYRAEEAMVAKLEAEAVMAGEVVVTEQANRRLRNGIAVVALVLKALQIRARRDLRLARDRGRSVGASADCPRLAAKTVIEVMSVVLVLLRSSAWFPVNTDSTAPTSAAELPIKRRLAVRRLGVGLFHGEKLRTSAGVWPLRRAVKTYRCFGRPRGVSGNDLQLARPRSQFPPGALTTRQTDYNGNDYYVKEKDDLMLVKDAAAEAAEQMLDKHWDEALPVDPVQIASSLNFDVLDAYLDADVAGAIEARPGKRTKIFLSVGDHPNRKRFTCAHEIGHSEKHKADGDAHFGYIDYRSGTASQGIDADEVYANAFAASLLMPERRVRRLRGEGLDEKELASRFGVSEAAMVNRLKNLSLYR